MYPLPPVTRIVMSSLLEETLANPNPLQLLARSCSQFLRGLLRRYIALRAPQQLKSNHEFPHRRGPQKRWVIMRVQVPLRMRRFVRWALMKTHRIGKRYMKQAVVTHRELLQHVRESVPLFAG